MAHRHSLPSLLLVVCSLSGCATGLNDNDIVYVGTDELQSLVNAAAQPGKSKSLALLDPRSAAEFVDGTSHEYDSIPTAPSR